MPTVVARATAQPEPDDSELLEYARERADYYGRWRGWIWTAHLWLTGLSYVFAVLVPFGLALLLHAPEQWRFAINVSALAGSCLSLVAYGLDQVQRLPDRALLLKRCEARLRFAICRYEAGLLAGESLAEVLDTILDEHARGDGV